MTRQEWIDCYAKRICERTGMEPGAAQAAAVVGADEYERAANTVISWERPEEHADDEMSCWDDDGDE